MSNFYGKIIIISRGGQLNIVPGEIQDVSFSQESIAISKTYATIIGVKKDVDVVQNLKPDQLRVINSI